MKLSRITLGTAQLGMDYGIANKAGLPSFENARKILHFAVTHGVNSFDTAPVYGESEKVIGKFFEIENSNPDVLITTKLPSLTNRKVKPSLVSKVVLSDLENSLNRLKITRVWNYLIHDYKDIANYGEKLMDALYRLKESGKVEHIGVSVYSPEEAEEILMYPLFDTTQFPFNLFDRRFVGSGVLLKLKKRGFLTLARSIFLQGLFFLNPEDLLPQLKIARDHLLNLRSLSTETHLSIEELALGYLKKQELVDSMVIGVETLKQLEKNLKILDEVDLSNRVLEEIERRFAKSDTKSAFSIASAS